MRIIDTIKRRVAEKRFMSDVIISIRQSEDYKKMYEFSDNKLLGKPLPSIQKAIQKEIQNQR